MAIIFEQQKKKQRNLAFVFLGFFVITVLVIWQGFFRKGTAVFTPTSPMASAKKEIKINFEILDSPQMKQLESFAEIQPFQESTTTQGKIKKTIKVGRENPFIPY